MLEFPNEILSHQHYHAYQLPSGLTQPVQGIVRNGDSGVGLIIDPKVLPFPRLVDGLIRTSPWHSTPSNAGRDQSEGREHRDNGCQSRHLPEKRGTYSKGFRPLARTASTLNQGERQQSERLATVDRRPQYMIHTE